MRTSHINPISFEGEWISHLSPLEDYVKCLRQGHASSPVIPLWHLRALHDKSAHAGMTQISDLCAKIEARIVAAYVSRDENSSDLMTELSRVTNIIQTGPVVNRQMAV
ncbi:MAG: hypothetical protein IT366_08135 [Candidatus Hydrogenedentes bacterium]|nr:hypothetical protein [Candidatus Hydrogenedentota bacterium]